MSSIDDFTSQLAPIHVLLPDRGSKRPLARPIFTRQAVTIIGVKTAVNRFLPVSHEVESNETYVDKLDLLGKRRAEFISRKLKGIERRAHMSLFRELAELVSNEQWGAYFKGHFGRECTIPNHLCIACWNCALFGGLETGRDAVGTFSRVRYFDTYSVEDSSDCIAMEGSEEGMAIGNQVYEDLKEPRTAATYHLYEYVKAGTTFPFLTIIESPTALDVAGYLATIRRADGHGYGKYSASHGKFSTTILAVATGYPRFSILDMLAWADEGNGGLARHFDERSVRFDSLQGSVALFGSEIEPLEGMLRPEFEAYSQALV